MRSFSESLQHSANNNIAETAFDLMEQNNIDPCEFLNWYMEECIYLAKSEQNKACEKWINESLGSWAGNLLGKAAGTAAKNLGGFVGNTAKGFATGSGLTNPNAPQTNYQSPTQQPQEINGALQAMRELSKYSSYFPREFYMSLHNIISKLNNFSTVRQECAELLDEITKSGQSPTQFVNWYITEGSKLEENEFWQGIGDALSRGWHGVKNVVNQFGQNIKQGGQQYQYNKNQERFDNTKQMSTDALQKLIQFMQSNKMGDNKFYTDVRTILYYLNQTKNSPQNVGGQASY